MMKCNSIALGFAMAAVSLVVTPEVQAQSEIGSNGATVKMTFETTGNPYLPLWEHIPDGEPRVFEDPDQLGKYRVYIIGSHDTNFRGYCGVDIRSWSAPVEDLSRWRDEGPLFTYQYNGKWDTMFAPDLVEVTRKDGKKEYYLYPHSCGRGRIGFVAKSDRPDGPFKLLNVTPDGSRATSDSPLGFDPSVFVEQITNPADPDYNIGFRAYAFWGFQNSTGAQLDQNTMYSVRPGTEIMQHFVPASRSYGQLRDPEGTTYSQIYPTEDPKSYNFFEASSIRQVGNKYVWIYSGYSGPDYGIGSSNSTLRYAYGDSPVGPWKSGGVLVDSRGPVVNADGSRMSESAAGHNTHGSLLQINDQWYVFYHRSPRSFGNARQSVVAPVKVSYDEKPVAEGGKVVIRGYNPYAADEIWEAKAADGNTYTGAEVTSEGFHIYGLNPYKFYSAGYVCYLSDRRVLQDSWDIWGNDMEITDVKPGCIIGYKYFGFGGLDKATKGLKPFEGTKLGNKTCLNLLIRPKTTKAFKVNVWMDGPWDNAAWNGKKLGDITVTDGKPGVYTLDVSQVVDNLDGKHAIYLVAEGEEGEPLFDFHGLGFSSAKKPLEVPMAPSISIKVGDKNVDVPTTPVRTTPDNAYAGYDIYEINVKNVNTQKLPKVKAKADNKEVKITVEQATSETRVALVKANYKGIVKTYRVVF